MQVDAKLKYARISPQKVRLIADMVRGEPVGKADADFVRSRTGFVIGGVAPVGHIGELEKFVDRSLAAYDAIWAAAGHPHTVFRLTYAQLLAITGGAAVDVAELVP